MGEYAINVSRETLEKRYHMAKKKLTPEQYIKNNVSFVNQQLTYFEQYNFTGKIAYKYIQEKIPMKFKTENGRLKPFSKLKAFSNEELKEYAKIIQRYKSYESSTLVKNLQSESKAFTTFSQNHPDLNITRREWRELFENSDFQSLKKDFGSVDTLEILKSVPHEKIGTLVEMLNSEDIKTLVSLKREASKIKLQLQGWESVART